MSELHYLLHLSSEEKKSDFAVKLTEGITDPEKLPRDCAATSDLRHDYDRALKLVAAALYDR